jgi:hypothetical protein
MVACDKEWQAMSEKNRKGFTNQHKLKTALEAIRVIKIFCEIPQEFSAY